MDYTKLLPAIKEQGLEESWTKHRTMHNTLVENLSGLGLEFVVDAAYRLPQLNLVKVPEGVDEAAVRQQLLKEFNLEIGAGLGAFAGKVWRVGLMATQLAKKTSSFVRAHFAPAYRDCKPRGLTVGSSHQLVLECLITSLRPRERILQESSSMRCLGSRDGFRASRCYNFAAAGSAFRSKINDPVSGLYDI